MVSFDTYVISGVTKDSAGVPTQKYVAVFERNGYLPFINGVLSDAVTGEYSVTCSTTNEHFVICFDSTDDPLMDGDGGENAQIYDRVVPITVIL